MSQKALTDADTSEGDVICAPKLLEVILQNCRGRVDECVPHFISLALGRQAFPRPSLACPSLLCPAQSLLDPGNESVDLTSIFDFPGKLV